MSGMPPLLRRIILGVVIVLALLAGFGARWRSQRGGEGTRIAFSIARAICPNGGGFSQSASLTAGARAMDVAVLRRAGDLVGGGTRCGQRISPLPRLRKHHGSGTAKPSKSTG